MSQIKVEWHAVVNNAVGELPLNDLRLTKEQMLRIMTPDVAVAIKCVSLMSSLVQVVYAIASGQWRQQSLTSGMPSSTLRHRLSMAPRLRVDWLFPWCPLCPCHR